MTITDKQQFNPDKTNPEAARAAFFTSRVESMVTAYARALEVLEQNGGTDPRHIALDNMAMVRKGAEELNRGLIDHLQWPEGQKVKVDGRVYWQQASAYPTHQASMAVALEDGSHVYFGIDAKPADELDGMRSPTPEDQMLLAADSQSLLDFKPE